MSTYRVRQGDTLTSLAARYHTTVDVLARTNGIADPDAIPVGMELSVPDRFDPPLVDRAAIGGAQNGNRRVPEPYRQWLPYVMAAARKHQVDPALLLALMKRESNGRNVVSKKGDDRGLMQISAKAHGAWLRAHKNGMDPSSNIDYGASILKDMLARFDGNLDAAVAAYNAGPTAVRRALKRGDDPNAVTTGENYATSVLRFAEEFRALLS